MRVFLTGFMGAGKSTVGRALARRLGVSFVDLDAEIERRAGVGISEIFARDGEARFRALEAAALRRCADSPSCVVATGGGTPVDPESRAWMAEHGRVVWLEVPFAEVRRRLAGVADRPLLADPERAERLFERRQAAYEECDLRVVTAGRRIEDVVEEVVSALERVR